MKRFWAIYCEVCWCIALSIVYAVEWAVLTAQDVRRRQ